MIWLLIYVLTLSLYDLRTRRIPNWATFPLILAGLVAHFPGHADILFANIGLFLTWASGWMGTGTPNSGSPCFGHCWWSILRRPN